MYVVCGEKMKKGSTITTAGQRRHICILGVHDMMLNVDMICTDRPLRGRLTFGLNLVLDVTFIRARFDWMSSKSLKSKTFYCCLLNYTLHMVE